MAIDHLLQQLVIVRERGDRHNEGYALGNLGNAYQAQDDAQTAIGYYEQHLAVARVIGDRQGEAVTSWNFGLLYAEQGRLTEAITLMQIRVDYEQEIGHPDAEKHMARILDLRERLKDSPEGSSE